MPMYNWRTTSMIYIPHNNSETTTSCTECREICEDWCNVWDVCLIIFAWVIIISFIILIAKIIIDLLSE